MAGQGVIWLFGIAELEGIRIWSREDLAARLALQELVEVLARLEPMPINLVQLALLDALDFVQIAYVRDLCIREKNHAAPRLALDGCNSGLRASSRHTMQEATEAARVALKVERVRPVGLASHWG